MIEHRRDGKVMLFFIWYYNHTHLWYDPSLGLFTSADTIVQGGVQGYDRYAYVNNNPIKYTDPSGHDDWSCNTDLCRNDVQDRRLLSQSPNKVIEVDIVPYINAVARHYKLKIPDNYSFSYWSGALPEPHQEDFAITTGSGKAKEYTGQTMNPHTIYIASKAFDELNPSEFASVVAHETRHASQYTLIDDPSKDKHGAMNNLPSDQITYTRDVNIDQSPREMFLEADAYAYEAGFSLTTFGYSETDNLGNALDVSNEYKEDLRKINLAGNYVFPLPFCEPICQ